MKSLMKPLACVFLALSLLAVAHAAEAGKPPPDFAVADIAGRPVKLSDYRGKVVILEWLNPACPYVLRHYRSGSMPSTQAAAAADGVVWIQVNSTAMGDLDAVATMDWQKKQGVVAT